MLNIDLEKDYDVKFGKIDSFKIDEAHGCLVMHFGVEYDDGYHQGVGGYTLDDIVKDKKGKFLRRNHYTQCFNDFLAWVWKEFGCDDYGNLAKDIVGTYCIVYFKKGDSRGVALGIRPFGGNDAMIFPDFMGKYFPANDED